MRYAIIKIEKPSDSQLNDVKKPCFFNTATGWDEESYTIYETMEEAIAVKTALEKALSPENLTYTNPPEYLVVNYVVADFICSKWFGNDSAYDWIDCDCMKNDNKPCMICKTCNDFRIKSDIDFVLNHQEAVII
jgi:hypothetical protein